MAHRVWATLHNGSGPLRPDPTWLLTVLALLTFIGPLWANLLVWPVEYLLLQLARLGRLRTDFTTGR